MLAAPAAYKAHTKIRRHAAHCTLRLPWGALPPNWNSWNRCRMIGSKSPKSSDSDVSHLRTGVKPGRAARRNGPRCWHKPSQIQTNSFHREKRTHFSAAYLIELSILRTLLSNLFCIGYVILLNLNMPTKYKVLLGTLFLSWLSLYLVKSGDIR